MSNAQMRHTYKKVQRMKSIQFFYCACANYVFMLYPNLLFESSIFILASMFIEQKSFHMSIAHGYFSQHLVDHIAVEVIDTLVSIVLYTVEPDPVWTGLLQLDLLTDLITTFSPSQQSKCAEMCSVYMWYFDFKEKKSEALKKEKMQGFMMNLTKMCNPIQPSDGPGCHGDRWGEMTGRL